MKGSARAASDVRPRLKSCYVGMPLHHALSGASGRPRTCSNSQRGDGSRVGGGGRGGRTAQVVDAEALQALQRREVKVQVVRVPAQGPRPLSLQALLGPRQ